MKKILNILYSILGIIGGIIIANLVNLVSTDGFLTGNTGETAYVMELMIIMLMGAFLYNYLLKVVRSLISAVLTDSSSIYVVVKYINLISYIIATAGCSYLILKNTINTDTALFATVIIGISTAIFTFVYNRNDDEFFIAIPKVKNSKIDKIIIKENNKRVIFNILGTIFGIAFTIFITYVHKLIFDFEILSDKEVNNVLRIVIVASISAVVLLILNYILMIYCKRKYNKKISNYYVVKDYFVDSFTIMFTILSYLSFVFYLGINRYIAILYVIGIKLIIKKFLPESYDPDAKYTGSTGNSYWYEKYVKDSHSDCSDMKFGFFSNGTSYFSYDIAPGISKTSYTDINGNKTDVTSFDITDNLKYKSFEKRD